MDEKQIEQFYHQAELIVSHFKNLSPNEQAMLRAEIAIALRDTYLAAKEEA